MPERHDDYYLDGEWHAEVAAEMFMVALAEDDVCPKCLGDLDMGWECNKCGYDASWLLE